MARLGGIYERVVKHELTARVRAGVARRSGDVPVLVGFDVVLDVIKQVFRNRLGTERPLRIAGVMPTRIAVSQDIVVEHVRRILRLIRRIARRIVLTLQHIAVCRISGIVEMLKDVVVDVVAKLANTLRYIPKHRILEVIETWETRPSTNPRVRV